MTTKEIREKYQALQDKEIAELQSKCPHIESKWCEEQWAPGHSTGRQLKICDVCEKILEESTPVFNPVYSDWE